MSIRIVRDLSGTLSAEAELVGEITDAEVGIIGTLADVEGLTGEITVPSVAGGTAYTGTYTVNPTFADQTLETNNKYMQDDVTVTEIKVSSVSNLAGGRTVTIGG